MSVILNPNMEPAINATVSVGALPIEVVFPTAQEIIISDANDSIKIGNGSGSYAGVSAGSLQVVDSGTPVLVGGTYNEIGPTLLNTEKGELQLDINGNLKTSGTVVVLASALPSGAATAARQDIGNTSLASIDSKLTSPITVTGPLTDTQLRATPVPVSGTVTANAGTNLNTSLLALDSTVAKDASLTTLNTSVNTLLKPANTLAAVTTVGAVTTITNVVHVDDNAGSLTVDGSVTCIGQTFDTGNNLYVDTQSQKTTYAASSAFTLAANPTDVFTIAGSGTKTIKITSIRLRGTNTGNTNARIILIKRSTADTAGTSSTLTNVPHDSNDAAATATVKTYTANPTLGTIVGSVREAFVFLPTLASTNAGTEVIWKFGVDNSKPIVLRGTAQMLAVNLNGAAVGGTTVLSIEVVWTEE